MFHKSSGTSLRGQRSALQTAVSKGNFKRKRGDAEGTKGSATHKGPEAIRRDSTRGWGYWLPRGWRRTTWPSVALRPLRLCVSFLGLPQDRMKREKLCRRQLLRTGLLGDSDLIENGGHSLGGKACQLSNPSDQLLPPKPK